MKSIKLFLAILTTTVLCCGGALAGEGCGKEHKCCAEAKKAGKACEKCPPKEESKETKK